MLTAKELVLQFFVFYHVTSFSIDALWLGECNKPLGISTGSIPDSALTASSSHDMIVGPHRARLGRENGGGAWCPRGMVDKNQLEYIEVNLGSPPRLVTGVGTQGRFANNFGVEYTPAYTVEFMRPGTTHFQPFAVPPGSNETLLFVGNTDTFTEIKNEFDLPLLATRVRIRPISVHPRVVCLRFELYGCNYTGGLNHYEIEGRGEKYEVGEGLLFDGSVTTSLSLEADITDEGDDREPKVKRSIQDSQKGLLSDKLYHRNIEFNYNSSQDSGERIKLSNSPDEVDESLSIPAIPPGEIVAPELPLNVTFIFNKIMNFSKIYIYIDPIHPLIAGAHPLLMISLNYGLDSLTWMEPPAVESFPIHGEARNVTVEAKGRSAQILQIFLTVDHAEINIQEIYFQSDDCDCSSKAMLSSIPPQVPKNVLFKPQTSNKVSPNKKSENFISDDASFRITSEDKTKIRAFAKSNQKVEAIESSIKISGEEIEKPDSKIPTEKKTQVTSVRAVHTSTTHRAYVGVAVGFSVGVGVLLCVWVYLCVKSSRSKANSPKLFKRSHPDTLDMACLMDGTHTEFGMTTPTNENFNDINGTSTTRSFLVVGPSSDMYNSQTKFDRMGKVPEDLQKAPLVSPVASSNDFKAKKLFYNNRSLYFGHKSTIDADFEICKKPNFSKTQISIFGKTKKNISGIKTDATFARHLGDFRHRPDISFISSDNGRSVFSSWDANVNIVDLSTLNEDDSSRKRLHF